MTWITLIGIIVASVAFFIIGFRDKKSLVTFSVVVIGLIGMIITIVSGYSPSKMAQMEGAPKTSIKSGTYSIVGYMEVSKDKQPYYQMILEQEGNIRLYTLPKDMIDISQSNEKPNVLEVIEKANLRKAILYLPANQISHQ